MPTEHSHYVYVYRTPIPVRVWDYRFEIGRLLSFTKNDVFYVGSGQNDRIDSHEKEVKKGIIKTEKQRVIAKILAKGLFPVKEKIFVGLTGKEARKKEQELGESIDLSNLTNVAPPGKNGVTNHSKETKEKIKKASKRCWKDPDYRAKVHTSESNKRISETLTGRKFSEERKAKHKLAMNRLEVKQKLSAAGKGRPSWNKGKQGVQIFSSETRIKCSDHMKEEWKRRKAIGWSFADEVKAEMSHQRKGKPFKNTENSHKKRSDTVKKLWKDPSYRENLMKKRVEVSSSVSYRKKMSNSIKEVWRQRKVVQRGSLSPLST